MPPCLSAYNVVSHYLRHGEFGSETSARFSSITALADLSNLLLRELSAPVLFPAGKVNGATSTVVVDAMSPNEIA
jgi:hypothetical protein